MFRSTRIGLLCMVCVGISLGVLLSTPTRCATDQGACANPGIRERYAALDKYAQDTPDSEARNVKQLASYLIIPARNDAEKARVIFAWIAGHVRYDFSPLQECKIKPQTPEEILASRSTKCGGFADLFAALATGAGLSSRTVNGHSKGFGYSPGDTSTKLNHRWNVVQIDGKWQLVDPAWGSGYVNEQAKWEQRIDDFYFLSDPRVFIYDHFPEDPKWQLFPEPKSSLEYVEMPYLKSPFFKCGLKLLSPLKCVVKVEKSLTVKLQAPKNTLVLAGIYKDKVRLHDDLVLINRDDEGYQISALFPSPGEYVLTVLAKADEEERNCFEAVSFKVNVSQGTQKTDYYPNVTSLFAEHEGYLRTPMTHRIPVGQPVLFDLDLHGTKAVTIVNARDERVHLIQDGESRFKGSIVLPPGRATLEANFNGGKNLYPILHYDAQP